MKSAWAFLAAILLLIPLLFIIRPALADEYSDLQAQLDQKIKELSAKQGELAGVQSEHQKVSVDVAATRNLIDRTAAEIEKKKEEIARLDSQRQTKELELSQKEATVSAMIKEIYKSSAGSSLELILSSQSLGSFAQSLVYYKAVAALAEQKANDLGAQVTQIKVNLISDRDKKDALDAQVLSLAQKKKILDSQLSALSGHIQTVSSQISTIQTEIANITARQQQILAEKTGNFLTSVGDVPPADDPASRLDYNPGFSPAFAGFSFGAPHRKGMSQYGAYGRAKSGQNYQDILKGYYGSVSIEHRDLPGSIQTTVGTISFEDNYLMGIAEMPSSWADSGGYEALKAQAVAARSYAMNAGKPICVTESCQVYSSSKAANPPDAWRRAVNETRGQVVVANGQILSTWYASTSGGFNLSYTVGGYTTSGGWDTKCGSQSCWTGDAYEKISGSPWFYKAWYRPRYGSASRSNPWLNRDEFADIVNSALLYQKDNGTVTHLSQTDKSNPDTWSADQVRGALSGDAISNVTSVSVTYSTGGFTSNVHLETA